MDSLINEFQPSYDPPAPRPSSSRPPRNANDIPYFPPLPAPKDHDGSFLFFPLGPTPDPGPVRVSPLDPKDLFLQDRPDADLRG